MCAPVRGAFRKALGLMTLTRGLQADVVGAPATAAAGNDGTAGTLLTPLGRVEADLKAATDALAGRVGAPAVTGAGLAETPAQTRARIALGLLTRTPAQARTFLAVARGPHARVMLGATGWRTVRRHGVVLLRGTKSLKAELRRLRQVTRTFVR
jgi:hypothetical protein